MNEFNINPEYKKYKQNKKKKAARLHKVKIIAATAVAIIAIFALIAFLVFKGNDKNNNTTTPPTTQLTESAVVTDTAPHIPTIFIHAGHGAINENGIFDEGIGNGSTYYEESRGKTESDLTLELALKLRDVLTDHGYKVMLSREDTVDYIFTDEQLCNIINSSSADVVISIHGRSGMPSDRGAAVIYTPLNKYPNSSRRLAGSIADAIDRSENEVHSEETDVITTDLTLLRECHVPAIQIEALCLTNELDAKLAVSQAWQENFTSALAAGIEAEFPIEEIFEP